MQNSPNFDYDSDAPRPPFSPPFSPRPPEGSPPVSPLTDADTDPPPPPYDGSPAGSPFSSGRGFASPRTQPQPPQPPAASEAELAPFLIPLTFQSRTVDVAALPPDALLRVAALSRARRARDADDDAAWNQRRAYEDARDAVAAAAFATLDSDETAGRTALAASAARGFERLQRAAEESAAAFRSEAVVARGDAQRRFDAQRDRRVREAKDALLRETFRVFWASHGAAQEAERRAADRFGTGGAAARHATLATEALRTAYEFSAPPFATDPEELWRRGITVAPDLQRGATGGGPFSATAGARARNGSTSSTSGTRKNGGKGDTDSGGFAPADGAAAALLAEGLRLPPYHAFSARMRAGYAAHAAKAADAAAREAAARWAETDGASARRAHAFRPPRLHSDAWADARAAGARTAAGVAASGNNVEVQPHSQSRSPSPARGIGGGGYGGGSGSVSPSPSVARRTRSSGVGLRAPAAAPTQFRPPALGFASRVYAGAV